MKLQEKEAIRAQLSPLMETYTPVFAEHGVRCSLHFRRFDQPELDSRSPKRRLFDDIINWLRKIFTGKNQQPENQKIRTWCVILRFSPLEKPVRNDLYKEYAFVFRYKDKYGSHIKGISRPLKRTLEENRKLLDKQDASTLYTDNWWDVLRYTVGNYWYKETAEGINLTYLRLALLVLCAILGAIGLFIF